MHNFISNDFEGPLDLLLHLVEQSDIDIYDINLEDLVNQYLDYINELEKLELNVASEYIVMAAELIELKSKSLLPQHEEEEEESPREELINRLIEYKKYKEITTEFKELENSRKEYYSKQPSSLKEYVVEKEEKGDISLLINAFSEFMQKKKSENIITKTTNKEYSVTERKEEIKKIIFSKTKVEFTELFSTNSRDFIIVTFLALLEMAKENDIDIIQEGNFNKIFIVGGKNEGSN